MNALRRLRVNSRIFSLEPGAAPAPNTWSAYPYPSSIGLYKEGQGYPQFDPAKAKRYFARVNEKVGRLVEETIRKWDLAGIFN